MIKMEHFNNIPIDCLLIVKNIKFYFGYTKVKLITKLFLLKMRAYVQQNIILKINFKMTEQIYHLQTGARYMFLVDSYFCEVYQFYKIKITFINAEPGIKS